MPARVTVVLPDDVFRRQDANPAFTDRRVCRTGALLLLLDRLVQLRCTQVFGPVR